MRPHVLVVDDDRRIRDLLCRYLEEQGFVVVAAGDAFEAEVLLKSFEVDVLVVDVMMPGKTGLEFTQEYRAGHDTPVLLLTALGETEDRISGLEAGADDYLPKPFEPRELVLRLNAILKRTVRPLQVERSLKIGAWVFDPLHEELSAGERIVRLTSAEAQLLKALGARGGEVMSREELARACGVDAGERTIDVQVTRLRRKIEEDTKAPRYLQTVRGKGYVLRCEALG
ncbi:MAG: response regulator [Rhodospirillales bacterium]|nr:response regulator [Rhodospirillales bacterium]